LAIALEDKWIWDFWLVRDGHHWHAYFLQADKTLGDPELRHRNVTIGHAISRDLVNWDHLGTCFGPSAGPAWDDWTTWTGSVLQGPDKVWHLFYTGTCHDDSGMQQRIGHATSTDMHSWQRVGSGLALDVTGPLYEPYTRGSWHDGAFRDPWVIPNPSGGGWLMYFTARVPDIAEANAGGAIGFATSEDLNRWTLQPPVYRGGMFGQLEVPQVIEIGGRWYCLFCTAAEHWSKAYRAFNPQPPVTGTHYLIADHALGPWTLPEGDFFDGATPCRRYAGRLARTDQGFVFMGFVHTTPESPFLGEVCDPIPVSIASDGRLILHPERVPEGGRI
jgi:beta-fructofuranosidase